MTCKDCEKRHINCHSTCEDYKAYKDKLNAERSERCKACRDERYFKERDSRKSEMSLRYKRRLSQRKRG